jgi:carbamoyl-phosphate synthase small subunit
MSSTSEVFDSWLVLKDGRAFRGKGFGAQADATGEVVFNTSMTGYQEILTDASYAGQIVTMTYPLIGNTGISVEDHEVKSPSVRGLVVRDACTEPSNFRSSSTLQEFLDSARIVGIEGVDTRALTRHIRDEGAMMGIISRSGKDVDTLRKEASLLPDMEGQDLVREVTCKAAYTLDGIDTSELFAAPPAVGESPLDRVDWLPDSSAPAPEGDPPLIAVVDYGVKLNILRCLVAAGFRARVFPATASADEILAIDPAGVFLSNGPGDPAAVTYAIDTVRRLLDERPIFGICLGHQILALALGAGTYKLKFGHHGANHPVLDHDMGRIEITSQNHGFAVDPGSLDEGQVRVTHTNLNDGTVEGLRSLTRPLFSVQYHPEASPGPHDALHHFARFRGLIGARKRP